ncbi:MAG: GNAT family N-acetyltransferase [Candidatus Eremiobacteraeota bacterium]|nr:GNAT family N-acetyltransferase [Candidatus Eremiobacteraeota bacterium]
MRRTEFAVTDADIVDSVLTEARIGHLAYQRDGEIELLPYNFVFFDGQLYFHASPQSGLARAAGQSFKFLAYDQVAWIPSTWRHPDLACPATTYYASVSVRSTLVEVTETEKKADVLEYFMEKYQSEPYRPLRDSAYHGPLKALFVGRLEVKEPVCKLKMGQHLSDKHRGRIYENLRKRGRLGDRRVAHAMAGANSELGDPNWVEDLTPAQTAQVAELLRETYWAQGRTVAEQKQLNEQTHLLLAHCIESEVVAFARVVLLNRLSAYLADVVVHPEYRGNGLGTELMERLFKHPRIAEVGRFMLVTKTAQSLYLRFGFKPVYQTDTTFMVREPRALYPSSA